MTEFKIDIDAAEDYDPFVDFPKIIYHFGLEDRPIKVLHAMTWSSFYIGEKILHQGTSHTIQYFGTLDCDLSHIWSNCEPGAIVAIVEGNGFAHIDEIKKPA